VITVHTVSLEAYGALRVSTRFTASDDWHGPTLALQIDNGVGGSVRIRFTDPDALDHVAAAVRTLQADYRHYRQIVDAHRLNNHLHPVRA
jgi:hypothetical protein